MPNTFEHAVKRDVKARRVREGVKATLEEVLEEETTDHLKAGYRERISTRRSERNLHCAHACLHQPARQSISKSHATGRTGL